MARPVSGEFVRSISNSEQGICLVLVNWTPHGSSRYSRHIRRAGSTASAALVALSSVLLSFDVAAQLVISPAQFDVKVSAGHNANVNQAERSVDIVDDRFLEFSSGAGYRVSFSGGRVDAFGRAFVSAQEFADVKGLGHRGGGLEAGVEGAITNSPLPPFYRLSVRVTGEDYDFKQRDSTVYTGDLLVGANITPRTIVSLGGEYRAREARSDVFDLSEWSVFADLGVEIAPSLRAGLRMTYTDGDVWSTIQAIRPNGEARDDIFDLIAAATAIQRDEAFNAEFEGVWFAYRLPATTGRLSLTVDKTFRERWSVGLQWLEIRVKADRDNDYDNRLFRLSLGLKF